MSKSKLSRRQVLAGASATVASPVVWTSSVLAQSVTTLKLHHFLPPVSNGHSKMLAPWGKKLEEASAGKIKVEIYPSMQLGGTPPQLYDQARDGVADIVWTLPGYNGGRFPTTETFELPFIAARAGIANAKAAQDFADVHLKTETKEVKLLSFWAHDYGLLHTNKAIATMEDLKGLKIRSATRIVGEMLKALGAIPVGMPVPQVPEALAQKVIDGVAIPWEVVPAVKVHELTKFHTDMPGSPALYTATFFLAMNPKKYEELPAELRAIMDKESGQAFAQFAGKMWDDQAITTAAMVKARGNTLAEITADEKAKWVKACEPVTAKWIEDLKAKNLDGAKLIADAKALIAKYDKA
jgi:TRAP-type transport system periplasmic protein